MIAEGWQSLPLAAIAKSKIVYGIVQAGPHDPTGVPYLKSSDIGGQIDCSSLQRTAPEIHQRFGRSTVVPGDIVISLRGNIGDTSIVPDELVEANLTQGTARISVADDFDRDFIFFQLASADVQRRIHSVTKGSTFVEITLDDLRKIEVPVPECRRQQRYIADFFIDWNRAIETVEALIANARAQKKALMQQLLPQGTTSPKKRLPGFSGEWREVSLADLLSVKRAKGKIVPTNEDGDGVPYIGSTSFLGEFSNFTASNDALLCVENDILVLWDGEYAGKVATGLAGAVSSTVGRYRLAKAKADPLFVVTLMEKASERIRSIREGSGIPHMPGDFEHWFKFALPPLDEQRAIAEVFKATRVIADELQSQLTALRQEKAALMQQLLTGKRRVKLPESEVA